MKIAVVGVGYVGLVVGACFAENGNDVVCVDNNATKVRALRRGRIPIYEPGLEELVVRNQREKRLSFTTALARAVRASKIIFIAVGTPSDEDGAADLQHVLGVARGHRESHERLQGDRGQEHRAGRNVGQAPGGHSPGDHPSVQRRQQPRVPEAGRGNRRFHAARPGGDRRRGPTGDGADACPVRALHENWVADHGDGLRQRGAEQVRGQRHAGHPRLVHERDLERLRAGVGRCRPRPPIDRRRPTDRSCISLSRSRVRRQLLSQGRQGADQVLA